MAAAAQQRAQVPKRILQAPRLNDQATGGSLKGHGLVVWRLVSAPVPRPVGGALYLPAPGLTAWHAADQKRQQHGVPAHSRPPHPGRNPDHPPKPASAVPLLEAFARDHPSLESTRGLADAWSATPPCMDQARLLFGRPVLSPLRPPHNGRGRPPRSRLEPDVSPAPGVPPRVQSRGGAEVPGTVPRARRAVDAPHTKRVVVALPYAPETDSR